MNTISAKLGQCEKMKEKIDNLSDKDIVLYALYLLGGWQKRVHTEDICFEVLPNRPI